MTHVHRIIDANANRAREALRVMEDAARFLLDDAALAGELKALRHRLAGVMAEVPGLLDQRDTPGDVGTAIATEAERQRADAAAVALAAGKRLSEALRSLEEYGKTLGAEHAALPRAIEAMRYTGYELERRLNLAMSAGNRSGGGAFRGWRVCLLLTESLCRRPWREVLDAALDAGVDCVQVREKTMEGGALLERARAVAEACHAADRLPGALARLPGGADCIVNDRPDVAALAGADGVHLGQRDLPADAARQIVGERLLIGVSTSSVAEAQAARDAGADYVGVGPTFTTTTKHKPTLAGPGYLRDFLASDAGVLPHLAIGGVSPANVHELIAAGARGIAASGCVCGAEDPGAVGAGVGSGDGGHVLRPALHAADGHHVMA